MNGDGVSEGGLSRGITQGEGYGSSGSEVDVLIVENERNEFLVLLVPVQRGWRHTQV